jgi:Fe-S-cluster containining protein
VTQALAQITPGMAIEHLPCSSCTALCCGPVPISEAKLPLIREHLRALPGEERRRLGRQKREYLDCGFLDKDNHRCTIYQMRPWVCEAFGRVEDMMCPKVDRLVQIIPAMTADEQMRKETATPIVASSDQWNWSRLDFE